MFNYSKILKYVFELLIFITFFSIIFKKGAYLVLVGRKPLILIILDGFGVGKNGNENAICAAKTPNLTALFSKFPVTEIGASGVDVGLPEGQMGNSEVGHTNIGAGRVIYQDLTRISNAIENGDFFNNEVLKRAILNCKANDSALHLMGLISDGGVHSHLNHLFALIRMAKENGLKKVYVHAFTDGRDVLPASGLSYVKVCEKKFAEIGVGKFATISGRFYAMDRDNRWVRVEKAYAAIVYGYGLKKLNAEQVLQDSYSASVTDEFVEPAVCLNSYTGLNENDSLIFFNFRPDRARELTRALTCEHFDGFNRNKGLVNVFFVSLTCYDETFTNCNVAFKPEDIKNIFGEFISNKGFKQLRIAETEKYAHVTFFFNGGREQPFKNETRILVKSPQVATYDLKPEMSAFEITDKVIESLNSSKFDVVILNYANCDMVGHTGVFSAAVRAVEVVDDCVGRVVETIQKLNGVALITADHGNIEKMLNERGEIFTAHTNNPVKFCVVGMECKLRSGGRLCDIAPTMLEILGLESPVEMTGKSLIL